MHSSQQYTPIKTLQPGILAATGYGVLGRYDRIWGGRGTDRPGADRLADRPVPVMTAHKDVALSQHERHSLRLVTAE